MKRRSIMIVAGEASGDRHGARLVTALREAEPDTEFHFFGAAGPQLREAGVEAIERSDELSVVGLSEIGRALPMFVRIWRQLKNAAAERRPDAVVLIDFPDFNLKFARSLKKRGHTVIYYISPQLWAWRKYRVGIVRKFVGLMITILPFEKVWYADRGVDHVEYVGNPLARDVVADVDRVAFMTNLGLDATRPLIALLPGSRLNEIERILPVMLDSAAKSLREEPRLQFVVPVASEAALSCVESELAKRTAEVRPVVVSGQTYNALAAADAAAVTSGTATLETALLGTPMVIVYKTSAVNYALLEPMITVDHYGLVNLIAGKRLATELIQRDFTAERLANELHRLLDTETNAAFREELASVADKLGHGGASKRAAQAILKLLDEPHHRS